ncbi:hypothetical protein GGI43DRAFT_226601 [Trichoderma evansii]
MNFPSEMVHPYLDMFRALDRTIAHYWSHQQLHHIQRLVITGRITVSDGVTLHINDRGFVTSTDSGALPNSLLQQRAPLTISGLQERLLYLENLQGPLSIFKEEIEDLSLVADLILITLAQAPAMRCTAWKRFHVTLFTAPPAETTRTRLLSLLRPALEKRKPSGKDFRRLNSRCRWSCWQGWERKTFYFPSEI